MIKSLLATSLILASSFAQAQSMPRFPADQAHTSVCSSLTAIREISNMQLEMINVRGQQPVSSNVIQAIVARVAKLSEVAAVNGAKSSASFKQLHTTAVREHARTRTYSNAKAPFQRELFTSLSMNARQSMMENGCSI